jgi:hypothetical protein
MPAVMNVGGPVGGALAIMLVTWAVRVVRSISRKQRLQQELLMATGSGQNAALPRYLFSISPAALRMLVSSMGWLGLCEGD